MNVTAKPAVPVGMGTNPGQSWQVTPDAVDMTRPPPQVRPLAITAEPQDIVVDAAKSALLIVDMQNDFCTTGGWLDSRGIDVSPNRKPIQPLAALIETFRNKQIPVVWVNWGVRKDLLNIFPSLRHAHNPRGDEPGLAQPVPGTRSEVIRAGSWGAQVVDEINPGEADVQIIKHRFSAFWDTETDAILRNMGIKTLFIGGGEHGPVRHDHARRCELPRLRYHPDRRRHRHHLPRLLRPGRALQCEAAVRVRHPIGGDPQGAFLTGWTDDFYSQRRIGRPAACRAGN